MSKLSFKVLAEVAKHAAAAGRADYLGRADDVARGDDPEWAWPFSGADEAYISAVGTSEICRKLGLSESSWDDICETWLGSFKAGYLSAHDEDL